MNKRTTTLTTEQYKEIITKSFFKINVVFPLPVCDEIRTFSPTFHRKYSSFIKFSTYFIQKHHN